MGHLNFHLDKKASDHAEFEMARIFKMAGFQYEIAEGYDPAKDLIIRLPECGKDPWTGQLVENRWSIWVEVKNDHIGGINGNVGIEWWCRGEPSGIWATESTYFLIVFAPEFFDINENVVTIWMFKVGRLRDAILDLTDMRTDEPKECWDRDNPYGARAWMKYDCGDEGSGTHLWICRQHHIKRYAEFIGTPSELMFYWRKRMKKKIGELYDEDDI